MEEGGQGSILSVAGWKKCCVPGGVLKEAEGALDGNRFCSFKRKSMGRRSVVGGLLKTQPGGGAKRTGTRPVYQDSRGDCETMSSGKSETGRGERVNYPSEVARCAQSGGE